MLSLFSPTVSSISNNLILFTTLKLIIYIYWWVLHFFFFRNISVESNLNVGKRLKKYKKLYLTVILLDLLLLRCGSCSLELHLIHDKININIIMLFRPIESHTHVFIDVNHTILYSKNRAQ